MERRTFLVGAASASLSAVSGGALGQVAEEPVRTAMIGTGGRGRSVLKEIMKQPGVKALSQNN